MAPLFPKEQVPASSPHREVGITFIGQEQQSRIHAVGPSDDEEKPSQNLGVSSKLGYGDLLLGVDAVDLKHVLGASRRRGGRVRNPAA
jgi:hypothetical protein